MNKIESDIQVRRELSRKSSAIYPEWASVLQQKDLERTFFQRCLNEKKGFRLGKSGSPNHGLQYWELASNGSPIFSISRASTDIAEQSKIRLDELIESLQKNTIVLFNKTNILQAKEILAIPKTFSDFDLLNTLVAKDEGNGIILVKP